MGLKKLWKETKRAGTSLKRKSGNVLDDTIDVIADATEALQIDTIIYGTGEFVGDYLIEPSVDFFDEIDLNAIAKNIVNTEIQRILATYSRAYGYIDFWSSVARGKLVLTKSGEILKQDLAPRFDMMIVDSFGQWNLFTDNIARAITRIAVGNAVIVKAVVAEDAVRTAIVEAFRTLGIWSKLRRQLGQLVNLMVDLYGGWNFFPVTWKLFKADRTLRSLLPMGKTNKDFLTPSPPPSPLSLWANQFGVTGTPAEISASFESFKQSRVGRNRGPVDPTKEQDSSRSRVLASQGWNNFKDKIQADKGGFKNPADFYEAQKLGFDNYQDFLDFRVQHKSKALPLLIAAGVAASLLS